MSYHVVVLASSGPHVIPAESLDNANVKCAAVLCAFEGLYPVSILGPDGEWLSAVTPAAMPRNVRPINKST